jgi:hypothetical protein
MNDWQQWAVVFILLGCAAWTALHLYHSYRRNKQGKTICDGCTAQCGLRDAKNMNNQKESTTFVPCNSDATNET